MKHHDFEHVVAADSVGASHAELRLVVEPLDDAGRECLLGPEVVEDQTPVVAERSGDGFERKRSAS